MTSAFEAIAVSESTNRIASYEPAPPVIAHSAAICVCLARRSILAMLVLCSTVSLPAEIANGQELPAFTSNAARLASGWWSPVRAESATAPQLLISMAELTHFEASNAFRTSPAEPTTYRATAPMDGSIASLQQSELTLRMRVVKPSLLDRVPLPPRSFSLAQAKYATWESSLADSRSLIKVTGASVYPLLQVNYKGWNLPVTLYISSLRGSDAR
jgi:hypothetical protein